MMMIIILYPCHRTTLYGRPSTRTGGGCGGARGGAAARRQQRRRWKGRGGAVRRPHVSQKRFAVRVRAGLASLLTNAIPGCTDPCSGRRRRSSFVHSKSRPFPVEFNCRCRCAPHR